MATQNQKTPTSKVSVPTANQAPASNTPAPAETPKAPRADKQDRGNTLMGCNNHGELSPIITAMVAGLFAGAFGKLDLRSRPGKEARHALATAVVTDGKVSHATVSGQDVTAEGVKTPKKFTQEELVAFFNGVLPGSHAIWGADISKIRKSRVYIAGSKGSLTGTEAKVDAFRKANPSATWNAMPKAEPAKGNESKGEAKGSESKGNESKAA